MLLESIQAEDLNNIRSGARDKKTSGLAAENALSKVFESKYRIRLDHQILTDQRVFYPQGHYNDLVFELSLTQAATVVRDSDPTKVEYKLTNTQLEYEML